MQLRLSNSLKLFSIDDEDYEIVVGYRWRLQHEGYVITDIGPQGNRTRLSVHRVILGLTPEDPRVDHIDGDTLNNKKTNLRVVDTTTNNLNLNVVNQQGTSKYRGVSWSQRNKKWQARRQAYGRKYHLGYFSTEEEAAAKLASWSQEMNLPVGYS